MEKYNDKDIFYIFDTYICGNRKDSIRELLNLKETRQEQEFLDQLNVYKKEFQIEILSYFYKNI